MLKSDLLTPACWNDYELLDSGNFEKLERFGRYVVARPEPQALWNRSLSDAEWRQRADAVFRKDRRSEDRGEWVCKPDIQCAGDGIHPRFAGFPKGFRGRAGHGGI